MDAFLVSVRYGNKHELLSFNDRVACLKQECASLKQIIWNKQVNFSWPSRLFWIFLVSLSVCISRNKNSLVRDRYSIHLGCFWSTPLKIKNVVCHVCPLLAQIFGEVKFLVNFAGFIAEFRAACPASSDCPRSLRRMEHKFLHFFARVQRSDIGSTVFGHPVYSRRS